MPGDRRTLVTLVLGTWVVLAAGLVLGWSVLTVPAGIMAAFLLPGALLLRCTRAWPEPWPALALSMGASLPLTAGVALVTAALPTGSTVTAMAAGLALVTAALAAPAYARASPEGRAAPLVRPATGKDRSETRRQAVALGSVALTAALVVATIVVSARTEELTFDRPLTHVGLSPLGNGDEPLDRDASVKNTDRVLLTVTNHEGVRANYEVIVAGPDRELFRESIAVADAETWTREIAVAGTGPITARVYGGSRTERGYREVRLGVR